MIKQCVCAGEIGQCGAALDMMRGGCGKGMTRVNARCMSSSLRNGVCVDLGGIKAVRAAFANRDCRSLWRACWEIQGCCSCMSAYFGRMLRGMEGCCVHKEAQRGWEVLGRVLPVTPEVLWVVCLPAHFAQRTPGSSSWFQGMRGVSRGSRCLFRKLAEQCNCSLSLAAVQTLSFEKAAAPAALAQ
eukprot:107369-Pelagomonas_calceolata.AAC.1